MFMKVSDRDEDGDDDDDEDDDDEARCRVLLSPVTAKPILTLVYSVQY